MGGVVIGMRTSVDGFVADASGDSSPLYPDLERIAENEVVKRAIERTGSVVFGRNTYDMSGGDLTDYEFQVPIFVLTHEPPDKGPRGQNENLSVSFVTEGIERAIELAREAAGERDVVVIGADVSRQAVRAGLVDEIEIGVVPLLLGDGKRFLDELPPSEVELEKVDVTETDASTELRFRVASRNGGDGGG
jgi:dihydrofolate reductase